MIIKIIKNKKTYMNEKFQDLIRNKKNYFVI